MNEFPPEPAAQPDLAVASLHQQVRQLNLLLSGALLALVILSGSLNIYLFRQVSYARKDAEVLRPQVAQLSADYQRVAEPLIKSMVASFQEYAKTHPDFLPILAKYKLTAAPTATAPSPAAPPAAK